MLASAGRPYPGVKVALFDEVDRLVRRGDVGELCVRGPLVMEGYQGQSEQDLGGFARRLASIPEISRAKMNMAFFISSVAKRT